MEESSLARSKKGRRIFGLLAAMGITIGVLLRLRFFITARSFWLDEICTALMIVNRSWPEIWAHTTVTPDFPIPPLIFSLIVKTAVFVFGGGELIFRAVPLLCGLAVLPLFYVLAKRWLGAGTTLLPLGLLALNPHHVYYSAELKPYATDALLAVGAIALIDVLLKARPAVKTALAGALLGAGGMWVSNATVFLFAAAGCVLGARVVRARTLREAAYGVIILTGWAVSFVALYVLSLRTMASATILLASWKGSFAPRPWHSWTFLLWIRNTVVGMIRHPLGLGWPVAALLILGAGLIGTYRKDRARGLFAGMALAVTFLAAVLGKYPFEGRMLLFLLPLLLLLLGQGVAWWYQLLLRYHKVAAAAVVAVLLLGIAWPLRQSAAALYPAQDNRQVMKFLCQHFRPGDRLVLNNEAQYAYWYYGSVFDCERQTHQAVPSIVDGQVQFGHKVGQVFDHLQEHEGLPYLLYRDIAFVFDGQDRFVGVLTGKSFSRQIPLLAGGTLPLQKGQRVWFLYANMDPVARDFFLRLLDRQGQRQTALTGRDTGVMLYTQH